MKETQNARPHAEADQKYMEVGPFMWKRDDPRDDRERWRLVDDVELIGMVWFCYPFHDGTWRCGSGSPWAPKYISREDAMARVVPFLVAEMKDRIEEHRLRLSRAERNLEKVLSIAGN